MFHFPILVALGGVVHWPFSQKQWCKMSKLHWSHAIQPSQHVARLWCFDWGFVRKYDGKALEKNKHTMGIFRLVFASHEKFSESYQHQESSIYVVQVWSLIFNIFIVKVQRFLDSWNQTAIKQDVTHECKTRMRWDSKNWIRTDRQKAGCLWVLKILHEVDAESQQIPKAFLDGKEIHPFIAVSIYTPKRRVKTMKPIHFGHEAFTWEGFFWPLALSFLDETPDVVSFNTLLSALEWPKTLDMLQEMQQQRWKTYPVVMVQWSKKVAMFSWCFSKVL